MAQRIFVKVVGFAGDERAALEAALASGQHEVAYAVWEPGAPGVAHAAVIDAQAPVAAVEAEAARTAAMVVAWVGTGAPGHAWRSFQRPVNWTVLLLELDELFAPVADELDFDLAIDEEPDTLPPPDALDAPDIPLDEQETRPPDTQPPEAEPPARRALIASASLDERLYLRAKLALLGLTLADEADSASQALELMHTRHYAVVWLDLALDGENGWNLLRRAAACHPERLIATKPSASWLERKRARALGATALVPKPLDPLELQTLLMG